jgi:hypothetical protein
MTPRTPRRPFRPLVELLDCRDVPAIVWANRLTPTDTFTPAERAVVDQAVAIWNGLIPDLNNGTNVFQVNISGGVNGGIDLGPGVLAQTRADVGTYQPASAQILVAARPGGVGWFVDPTPQDDAEFPRPLSPSAADGGPAGYDLLTAVVHELGHGLGINSANGTFTQHLADNGNGTFTYVGAGGLTATLDQTRAHLVPAVEGPDLMASDVAPGQRRLPSGLDLALLHDAYGDQVNGAPELGVPRPVAVPVALPAPAPPAGGGFTNAGVVPAPADGGPGQAAPRPRGKRPHVHRPRQRHRAQRRGKQAVAPTGPAASGALAAATP